MITYRNEAAFSNALTAALRARGWFVQRIESGLTGKGIPDIYTIAPGGFAMWLELKRQHTHTSTMMEIDWRTGQQSWLSDVVKYGQVAYTLAAFDNGIVQIPHTQVYLRNRVPFTVCRFYKSIGEMLQ